MKPTAAVRRIIDIAFTALLLCALGYRITGDAAHEWIGVCVFVVCAAHNIINLQWYQNVFTGRYNLRRALMSAVNLLLVFAMGTIIITGLLQSRTVLAFLHLPGGAYFRQIHTTAAYWLLPLIGTHMGLHWGMIMNGIGEMMKINGENRVRTRALRVIALILIVFGVWSSFDRDIFSKLFLGFSFDYWPEERPALLFFAETLSIMGIYVFVTYFAFKFTDWFHYRKI